MSQGDVMELLKEKQTPMSVKEMAYELGLSTQSVNCNVMKLVRHGSINVYKMTKPMLFCYKDEKEKE
jgi:predicted ArsR family transcriptional regulator